MSGKENPIKDNGIKGYDKWKRLLDCFLASISLIILSPVFIIVVLVLKIESPKGKTIFKQERIGRDGRKFNILKFRSLREDAPDCVPSQDMKVEKYVTTAGRVMRMTGLDELPQLFNVVIGDMSLVGPRPLIPEEGEIHENRLEKGIYSIRPGITGLAQVHGGNSIPDSEKINWDYQYLANRSLVLDITICLKTILLCAIGRITPHKYVRDKDEESTNNN